MVTVSLNNEPVEFAAPPTLAEAMQQWGYTAEKCAVAINGEFVPRSQYRDRQLQDADEVDVVAPVGGG